MITSSIPFPPVTWWLHACKAGQVTFDLAEHYQKMSYRNRYYLAAPEGRQLMSIPLDKGRNQRQPVSAVQIANNTDWQDNHWKTIASLYGRSPFFEYFDYKLKPLFEQPYNYLHDFNKAGILLVSKLLQLPLDFAETTQFVKHYPPAVTDLRTSLQPQQQADITLPEYQQVFADRTGFLPDCSILDLLFCEGSYASRILRY
jgi:hypothetical protein